VRQLEHDLEDVAGVRKELEAQLAEKTRLCASLQTEVDVHTPFSPTT
jgi:hypothetical protein